MHDTYNFNCVPSASTGFSTYWKPLEKTRSTTPLPVGIDFHLSSRAANDLYVDLRVDFRCLTSASVSA